jgi:tripartite-type tricarboxylate transporter receptor subunit TctC
MKKLALIALSVAHIAGLAAAHAQDYPTRNITIVSNYPPAGGVDITGRIVGAELQKRIGQSVIIENRPGATGTIGASMVAHSAPDGYTILVTANPAITVMPFMTKVSYDPVKDLIPIAKVAIAPTIVVVRNESPFKTFKQLVEAARDPAQKIMIGVPGVGSSAQIEFGLVNKEMKSHIESVPYRGAAFILNDVLSGSIPAGSAAVPAMAAQIWGGKMRGLVVVSPKRSTIFPELPTVEEALGFKLDGFPTWYGFFVPAKTPPAIVALLEKSFLEIMNDPAVVDKMKKLGNEVLLTDAKTFAQENDAEIDTLKKALKETNVSIPQ